MELGTALRWIMKSTIKSKLILSEILLLLCIAGLGSLFYMLFARDYYISQKKRKIEHTFESLKYQDLEELRSQSRLAEESEEEDDEIETFFDAYESENLVFIITDENFQKVYLTHQAEKEKKNRRKIYNNIEKNVELFTDSPRAVYKDQENGKGKITFYGLLYQDNRKYYVSIYEFTYMAEKSFSYANQFLILALAAAIVLGGILFYFLTEKITKPIQMMDNVTGRMARKDFSVRVHGPFAYVELERLGENINAMSWQIQEYIDQLEKVNGELMAENQHKTELEEMRKLFVNNVSHELKTPLAVISSQTEMLMYIKDEKSREAYCTSIMDEVGQMSDMISSMLAIFSIEHGLEELEMEPLDLGELAGEYAKSLKPFIEKKQIRFETEIESESFVRGNYKYIRSVINNYCMNACRHTKEGRQIILKVFPKDDNIVLSVYNEGKNIEADETEKIWNSFYQSGDSAFAANSGNGFNGTGLGLYIVKSIVKLHYGSCGVDNERNGVTFWCCFKKWKGTM